jgi:hypothetical protein
MLSNGEMVAHVGAGKHMVLNAGHYFIHEFLNEQQTRERYLGVIGDHYTVMQLTVGSFTSDTFDHPIHSARIPANYYVALDQLEKDTTFRSYEQDYGDDIIPHVMADCLSCVDSSYKQENPNWDSLNADEISRRLVRLDEWWQFKGLRPLSGIASYTPSNSLVRAMKNTGMNFLHSVVPEQNWSDGKWVINHWGMVNQPFYVSDEDFRKPMPRSEKNLIAMSMDSYHLYLPHVVGFGDFVLSPSHFLRWHRTAESGPQPERFTNFLIDYLQVARQNPNPYFLIAGFEFGRTYGTRSMTTHNRLGIERVIELAKVCPVVFSTARDVAAYYERHCENYQPAVFTQRDYHVGTRMMNKPVNVGPSIGMEMPDYKAVFKHGSVLPTYHYDYNEQWSYVYDDVHAPCDYASDDSHALQAKHDNSRLLLHAGEPLKRAIPVALWDARAEDGCGFELWRPPVLDDKREHCVVVVPEGFCGEVEIPVVTTGSVPVAEFHGSTHPLWRVQEIGSGNRRHSILYLEEVQIAPLELEFTVPAACRIDSCEAVLGKFEAGEKVALRFFGRNGWYRFWGLHADQVQPDAQALKRLEECNGKLRNYLDNANGILTRCQEELDVNVEALIPDSEQRVLHMDCFGNAVMDERSRAQMFDRIVYCNDANINAKEITDGGMAMEPAVSYWIHPRELHFVVTGLTRIASASKVVNIYLFSRSPDGEKWRYTTKVYSGGKALYQSAIPWACGKCVNTDALLKISVIADYVIDGTLEVVMSAAQMAVLDDWFRQNGFIAALERLVVTVN